MLSTGAFNALLKTLEEPPSYVIFILATTDVHKIPVTVLSRCQRYDFKRITVETIAEHLKELTQAEKIQVEEKALTYIAKSADGALRDALSLLDQCIAFHYGELLTYDNVLDVLGAVDITVFGRLFRAVAQNKTKDCIACLEDMVIQGRELGQFVVDFIWYLRNLLIIKSVDDGENLMDMSTENQNLLREDSNLADPETLLRYIRVFSDLSNQLRYASQKRVLIEVALIKLTRPQMEQNYDSILQRIKGIEKQLESGTFLQKGEASATAEASLNAGEALTPAQRVALPQGQLEDLNLIRSDWGKIIRELGGPIRASFRETVVEPAGESRLCVVFSDQSNYMIGSRETTIADIERYVEDHYKKSIAFQARLRGGGERMDTIYVSDEELKANILMDITIEE
jgi:DNA polymerase-3 subunit gamma/tau